MNRLALFGILAFVLIGAAAAQPNAAAPTTATTPAYTAAGDLVFPVDYRDWNFVTSGLGMSYAPMAMAGGNPAFDNVFVKRDSLAAFKDTGHWPDKTMFVIEVRGSKTKGSINKDGHFQNDLLGFDVEVKDSSVPGTWHYYGFAPDAATKTTSGSALPGSASCYQCHSTNAAVEHTFVQFYPALLPIAKAKGTLNSYYHDDE